MDGDGLSSTLGQIHGFVCHKQHHKLVETNGGPEAGVMCSDTPWLLQSVPI